jgi:hypothetical protein
MKRHPVLFVGVAVIYYVRVQQANGEVAWGSPMWIELTE